jgi:hypothetical protein
MPSLLLPPPQPASKPPIPARAVPRNCRRFIAELDRFGRDYHASG